jgi:hypothetical protein
MAQPLLLRWNSHEWQLNLKEARISRILFEESVKKTVYTYVKLLGVTLLRSAVLAAK